MGPFDETLKIGSDTDWFARAGDRDVQLDLIGDVVLVKGIGPENLSHQIEQHRSELISVVKRRHMRRRR